MLFRSGEGKLFLAGVRDLFHRGIVGWDTSGRQDTVLVVSALTMVIPVAGGLWARLVTLRKIAPPPEKSEAPDDRQT